jgi:hypothetical protein
MTFGRFSFVFSCLALAAACGGSDDAGIFGETGGAAGSSAGSGGSSGSGGTNGGASGSGGATGGASGSGGSTSVGGSSGAQGGSAGVGGGQGGVGGDAGSGQGGVGGDAGSGQGGAGGDAGSGQGGAGGSGGTGGAGGSGGGTSTGWCSGHCGTSQPIPYDGGNCYCDDQCTSQNDCCPDVGPVCNPVAGAGQVACGSGTCTLSQSFCCQQSATGTLNPTCWQLGGSTCIGPDIECDGPEDCPGQVCCSTPVSGGTNNVNFECRAAADCGDSSQRIVCGNDYTVCQPGQVCIPHPWVPQYNYCATQN